MAKNLARRAFLKSAAALAAAPCVIPSSALGKDGAVAPSERVTVAHIGVGGQGSGLLYISQCKGAQAVAICDAFQDRRERAATPRGAKAYGDFREVMARSDIDAVVIATPDHWHVPIAIAAARSGKDMYVEKPLGVCLAWDLEARREIHRYGRRFQYGTQQRSQGHCRYGCELVRSGRIGKIKKIEVIAPGGSSGGSLEPIPVPPGLDYDMWLGPAPWSPYTKDRCTSSGTYFCYDNCIGYLGGWGAHPLDILVWGFDVHRCGIMEVEGTGRWGEGLFSAISTWDVNIKFANGVEMTFKPGGDHTRFIGTDGWIGISRGGSVAEPQSLLKSTLGPNDVHLIDSNNHGQNYIDSVLSRAQPVSNIDDAVRSDIISHISDIAIRCRRKIRWDWEKEEIIGDPDASRMLNRTMRAPWTM